MNKGQSSFFDAPFAEQLAKMAQINDFLPKLNALIDWELFRNDLSKVREKNRLSNAGRPPFDELLMFKVLILKTIHNLSDDQIEYQIRDRISFRDFLGLHILDRIPDAKTIWLFADQLKDLGLERVLFDRFNEELDQAGFQVKSGLILDGSFVEVPRPRNTKEDGRLQTADGSRSKKTLLQNLLPSANCRLPSLSFETMASRERQCMTVCLV
jgi:transposase